MEFASEFILSRVLASDGFGNLLANISRPRVFDLVNLRL